VIGVNIYLDFDGTITTVDIGYDMFEKFGTVEPWITDLIEGRIGIREYWHGVAGAFTPPAPADLDHYLGSIPIDPGFEELIALVREKEIPLTVVSDGVDYYVARYLELHDVRGLTVRCNRGAVVPAHNAAQRRRLVVTFPDAAEGCVCMTAACKRNVVLTTTPPGQRIIYIGDGISDHCPAEHADVIFAKDRLAAYCNAHHLPHFPYRTLNDVAGKLRTLLAHKRLRERHQAAMKRKRAWERE